MFLSQKSLSLLISLAVLLVNLEFFGLYFSREKRRVELVLKSKLYYMHIITLFLLTPNLVEKFLKT